MSQGDICRALGFDRAQMSNIESGKGNPTLATIEKIAQALDVAIEDLIKQNYSMKLGIILQSNKPEHIWNTFRLGITALKASHQVEIFLMNEGSELDTIPDSKDFDISARVGQFKELKGEIYACGTCLELRGKKESNVCPISTMSDLLKMVEKSDKVLVFG